MTDWLAPLAESERRSTAHHEAGHAVTAVARGGTFDGFTIEATAARDGWVHVMHDPVHRDFVTFAGPWAEARAEWTGRPLDGVNEAGLTFHDCIRGILRCSDSDLRSYAPELDHFALALDETASDELIPLARDDSWYGELETLWPTMAIVAEMALRGDEVTTERVRVLLTNEQAIT